ncbi:MAG: PAS domain-containing protein, partial [Alphaproteobacteria bacterium]|nr:PAS domain-containing protein [Alphaproteobacteria bacterium]MBU1462078.1 PAS domain-containing protein [Alphaproteobacteria bacterium]
MGSNSNHIVEPDRQERASLRAMTGLCQVSDDVGTRVLEAQLRTADSVALLRQVMNLCGLVFIWQVFTHCCSPVMLGLWSAGLIGCTLVGVLMDRARRNANNSGLTSRDLRRHGLGALLQGIIWAACMMLVSPSGETEELVALWTLISCIMVCGAISYAATPLSAAAFLLPCIAGLFGMFHDGGQLPLRALATSYALSLLIGCVIYARTFARQHSTSVQLEEKSEVVSLLLREYEGGGSDWLWQTDSLRRISSVSTRFAETMGLDPAQLEGEPLVQILAGSSWESGRFAAGLHSLADHLKRRESFSNLVLPVEVKGETRWWELSASPRHDENGLFLGFRGVASDVTAQRESADKIARLARFDPLTGLPKRSHLREALDKAMAATRGRTPGCG